MFTNMPLSHFTSTKKERTDTRIGQQKNKEELIPRVTLMFPVWGNQITTVVKYNLLVTVTNS